MTTKEEQRGWFAQEQKWLTNHRVLVDGVPEPWEFFDQPGHFIGASSCRFFVHTHVGPAGKYCVSTVGDYHPGGVDEAVGIGLNRLYETMVFDWRSDNPHTELAVLKYNDPSSAHDGHLEVCYAWDRKDEDDAGVEA